LAQEVVKRDRPDFTAAKIVVSDGHAMGSSEQFMGSLSLLAENLVDEIGDRYRH